jgi:hypothetical protein
MVTAYALLGLVVADENGYTIPDYVLSSAARFLKSRLIVPNESQPRYLMNRQAFVLYALARAGEGDVARVSRLYDHRQRLSLFAQAFLAQTLALVSPDDTARLDSLISDIMSRAITSATGVHWEEDQRDYYNWDSDIRTTSVILWALIQARPDSDLLPNVVRHLLVERKAQAWETTQETAWAVMALTDWMVASGELNPNYTYSVSVNETELTSGTASADTARDSETLVVEVAKLLQDEANLLTFTRSAGEGALYYTAHLRAYLPVPQVEPLNRGILINRAYVYPGTAEPVTTAKVGDVLQVRLTVIAPNNLYYAVIEDPLPAGVEAINPDLETSQQVGVRPELNSRNPLSRGWGWWYFSNIEFRDEKVVLYSTYLPAGTYEYVYSVRVGIEGTYNVIPATGQEFYFPEVYGRSAGSAFIVLPNE